MSSRLTTAPLAQWGVEPEPPQAIARTWPLKLGLGLALVVILGLLMGRPFTATVQEAQATFTSCTYDRTGQTVDFRVPLDVSTRGEVTWVVVAEVYRANRPLRRSETETLTLDTDGRSQSQVVELSVRVPMRRWDAGFNTCEVSTTVSNSKALLDD